MERAPIDLDAYQRLSSSACFVCRHVTPETPRDRHISVYEDDETVAFLDRFPTLKGRILVAPRQHKEHVVADFTPEEFARILEVVRRVGAAVQDVLPTERLYLCSLGSMQLNRHVHWHVAALPPGVSYPNQQHRALSLEYGIVTYEDGEAEDIAARVQERMDAPVPRRTARVLRQGA